MVRRSLMPVLALGIGIAVVLATACGAPEPCPFGSGTADTSAFDASFTAMALAVRGTPFEAAPAGDLQFPANRQLDLITRPKAPLDMRVCVQERKSGGKVLVNNAYHIEDEERILLGPFASGPYVVRVGVGDTLVKNFPFTAK